MANLLGYATALHAKWEQREDSPSPCDHLSQVASLVVLSTDGYVTSKYHCRDCGEAIVRTYKASAISSTPSVTDPLSTHLYQNRSEPLEGGGH